MNLFFYFFSKAKPSFLAFSLALLIVLIFTAAGHDNRRTAQLLVLALPVLAAMLLPIKNQRWRMIRVVLVWLLTVPFLADSIVRAYLDKQYQAAPDSSTVVGAMANTRASEAAEYFSTYWRDLSLAGSVLVVGCIALICALLLSMSSWRQETVIKASGLLNRLGKTVLIIVLLAGVVAYANKPWRRLHPIFFWSSWSLALDAQQSDWQHQAAARQAALKKAVSAKPVPINAGSSTVVLVISESVNRDNLGLYGYQRNTTPLLSQQKQRLGENLVVLRNAWSTEASTIPALHSMLNTRDKQAGESLHMVAMARAAGYKVWWISNQDDTAIENMHARLADVVQMLSRTPGRSAKSLDNKVLKPMQMALADSSQRKLIVLHLMGAHPHYRFRFPEGMNPYADDTDAVDQSMVAQDRPMWVRQLRKEYDAALLYHDQIVSSSLDLLRTNAAPDDYRAWMFLSDHGQEVGHTTDRVGHSLNTAAGYRIPALIWQSTPRHDMPADVEMHAFRADWADMTLAHLLNIRWNGYLPSQDVLSNQYSWVAPTLPTKTTVFDR